MGPSLQREYPEIKSTLRVKTGGETLFLAEEKSLYTPSVIYADSTLFSFFDYEFIEGFPSGALRDPNGVVLTQKLALALFGKIEGVEGKTVKVKENMPFTVKAVIKDPPANHHFHFGAILPYTNEAVSGANFSNWGSFSSETFLMLDQEDGGAKLERKMAAFYKKYIAEAIGDEGNSDIHFAITFQPLIDLHLYSSHLMGEENGGSMAYVYTFSAVGLFILLVALFNYINLTTARLAGRAKEISIRKAVGSQRFQLVAQFLAESTLLAFLALGISLLLLQALLPAFNTLTEKALSLNLWNGPTALQLLGLTLAVGLISGLYPAFVLSGFRPTDVLKGASTTGGKGALMRQSLVVVQFTISIIMIVGTVVVYQQLQFMQNNKLGFNQDQVLTIPLKSPSVQQMATLLKNKLKQSALISEASLSSGTIGKGMNNKMTFSFYKDGKEQPVSTEYFSVDADFLRTLQIGMKEGRHFSANSAADSTEAVLVNEAMLKRLGWKNLTTGLVEVDTKKVPIAGVIKDFHIRSLREKIEPLVLRLDQGQSDNMLLRLAPHNISSGLAYIESTFKELNPGQPFDYYFLDQTFAQQYKADERRGNLFLIFSGIAIFIACLGLFGLATFTAEQRTKEIGVRKVLGASVVSIVALLSKDFLKLVLIAILIASPIAWYAMKEWLADFAYKIEISWWYFALAGGLAVGIALLTVSFQSVKAALMNPVKSLRSE
ncbi:ABC transporter permease [Rhabdobacter roseus]